MDIKCTELQFHSGMHVAGTTLKLAFYNKMTDENVQVACE